MPGATVSLADAPEGAAGELDRVPDDVRRFCEREGVLTGLRSALALADRHLPLVRAPRIDVLRDPESSEEWAFIRLYVPRDLGDDELFRMYDTYTDAWLDVAPRRARDVIRASLRRA
ncbi:MAG: hypothetical protein HY321_17150 [Armatimonadetes bacterium]|nr:hypothetical protein [Armatimonadota bacterium]